MAEAVKRLRSNPKISSPHEIGCERFRRGSFLLKEIQAWGAYLPI